MAVFTLRSSSTASALRSATPDYLRRRAFAAGWHVYISGTDDVTRVDLDALRITDSGGNATGKLQARHADPTLAFSVPAAALLEVVDGTGERVYWGGHIIARRLVPSYGAGQSVQLEAVDYSPQLDTTYIASDTLPAGWTDRQAIQYLVSNYQSRGLRAPDSTVAVTNASLSSIPIVGKTLRQAVELVAAAAGSSRFYFVDADNRLNYGVTGVTPAPYAIVAASPNGTTTIAADELVYESDESQIINAVYIYGATDPVTGQPVYGDWVIDQTSINLYDRREALLQNDAVVDASSANLYGSAYLARVKDPIVRGSFTVTGYDGWRAGQLVTITNASLGLSSATFIIKEVETSFLTGTATRVYRCAYGEAPKSLIRLLAST